MLRFGRSDFRSIAVDGALTIGPPADSAPCALSGPRRSPCPARRRGTTGRRAAGPRSRTGRRRPPGTSASAARAPPSFCAATSRLVAACATRRARRPAGAANARAAASKPVVGQHPVDDVPALERRRVVELAGHHELLGPRGARALGQPLRAAHRRRQPDDDLDEPEARRLGGQQQVAGQRELEGGRQAQRVRGEDDRAGQLLDGVDRLQQLAPQRGALLRGRRRRSGGRPRRRSRRAPRRGSAAPRGGVGGELGHDAAAARPSSPGRRGSAAGRRA